MQKFEFLRQPLLGELAMSWRERERKKEREIMPFIVATYVYASSQGQRTHSALTKIAELMLQISMYASIIFFYKQFIIIFDLWVNNKFSVNI